MGGILAVYGLIMILFPTMRFVIPWMQYDEDDNGRMIVGIASMLLSVAF